VTSTPFWHEPSRRGPPSPKRRRDRPCGIYAGYFRDLDWHLWEVMWNPQLDTSDA
jgi:hypothetical protein